VGTLTRESWTHPVQNLVEAGRPLGSRTAIPAEARDYVADCALMTSAMNVVPEGLKAFEYVASVLGSEIPNYNRRKNLGHARQKPLSRMQKRSTGRVDENTSSFPMGFHVELFVSETAPPAKTDLAWLGCTWAIVGRRNAGSIPTTSTTRRRRDRIRIWRDSDGDGSCATRSRVFR